MARLARSLSRWAEQPLQHTVEPGGPRPLAVRATVDVLVMQVVAVDPAGLHQAGLEQIRVGEMVSAFARARCPARFAGAAWAALRARYAESPGDPTTLTVTSPPAC